MRRKSFLAALLAAFAVPLAMAQPAAWPDKPIKWVLSQPPGSGPDNVARLLADRLGKQWGQAVVIENRPGGQNVVGAVQAARSPGDGYNFYFATAAALVTNIYLFKQLPYDPPKDFAAVGFVARSPFGVLVKADSPLRTIEELIARSKSEPGRMSIGNEGPRTFGGVIARLFNARTKADANLVSYASVSVSLQDLMGGHVDAVVADVASSAQLVKQGRLRMLAVTSSKRVPGFESVPTLNEGVMPGLEMVGWFALVAPTGTPQPVIERVNRDLNALLADRDVAERIAAIGPIADASMSPEATNAFLRAERARWGEISKEIGLLPE